MLFGANLVTFIVKGKLSKHDICIQPYANDWKKLVRLTPFPIKDFRKSCNIF